MNNHTCPCGKKYSFTDEDLRWSKFNTYCPRCHSSLSVQHYYKEEKAAYEKEKKEFRLKGKNCDFIDKYWKEGWGSAIEKVDE